jgi:hypothetical protein
VGNIKQYCIQHVTIKWHVERGCPIIISLTSSKNPTLFVISPLKSVFRTQQISLYDLRNDWNCRRLITACQLRIYGKVTLKQGFLYVHRVSLVSINAKTYTSYEGYSSVTNFLAFLCSDWFKFFFISCSNFTDLRVQNQRLTDVSFLSAGSQDNNFDHIFKDFFLYLIEFYCQQFFVVIKLKSQEFRCTQYKFSNRFGSLEIWFYCLILWLLFWSFLCIYILFTRADFVIYFQMLIELNWIELNWIELNWIELNWIELNWIELNWIELMIMIKIIIVSAESPHSYGKYSTHFLTPL